MRTKNRRLIKWHNMVRRTVRSIPGLKVHPADRTGVENRKWLNTYLIMHKGRGYPDLEKGHINWIWIREKP